MVKSPIFVAGPVCCWLPATLTVAVKSLARHLELEITVRAAGHRRVEHCLPAAHAKVQWIDGLFRGIRYGRRHLYEVWSLRMVVVEAEVGEARSRMGK